MSTGDIALGAAILEKARGLGIVQNLLYRDE
jgi:ornithine cyclodeaminase